MAYSTCRKELALMVTVLYVDCNAEISQILWLGSFINSTWVYFGAMG